MRTSWGSSERTRQNRGSLTKNAAKGGKKEKIGENGQLFNIFSPEALNGTTGTQFRKLRGKIP